MGMQPQGQQLEDPLKAPEKKRRTNDKRWLIAIIALVLIAGGAIFWLRDTQGSVFAILPIVIFTVLGIVVSLFQWLFPVSSGGSSQPMAVIHPSSLSQLAQVAQAASQPPQQIIVQVPVTDPPLAHHAAQTGPLDKTTYRGIMGVPPPTDPRTIQQRDKTVQAIYTKLCDGDVSALVLTGIGGVGKSTLAALVYRYAEAHAVLS